MTQNQSDDVFFAHSGYREICSTKVTYRATGPYFRSTLRCPSCDSVPRHRALFHALNTFVPRWREADVHESSPGSDALSARVQREAKSYLASQWDLSIPFGSLHRRGYRSEDLHDQTFPDASFDLVMTQDVFEHLFYPDRAIKEIARTLRPGGAYLMTVPIVRKALPSVRRASIVDGTIEHHLAAEYHGNPVAREGRQAGDECGSLVTIDWGYDIAGYLQHHSGLSVMMLHLDNIDLGIRADLIEVIIGFKHPVPDV